MRRLLLAVMAVFMCVAMPAAAAPRGDLRPISDDPVDWTPHVLDGEIRALAVMGDTVVVGGDFTAVTDSSGVARYDRWYLFAFSLSTGRVLNFAPWVDGPVLALEPGPGNTVYAGGRFRVAGDRAQRGIARFDLATGRPVDAFTAQLNWGDVRGIALTESGLYVGGAFERINNVERAGLARLDPVTGQVDAGFDAALSADELSRVKVEDLAVSPKGDKLVVVGAFTRSGAEYRVQIAMFDIGRVGARLADWWTDAYIRPCRREFDTYMRAVDFSPAGDYLVVVTTGRLTGEERMCDTAARFEAGPTGGQVATWVNHTGGDSLYAVEIDHTAVYVGGHQRWMNNPHGHESAGPGAIERVGLAAIEPVSGLVNNWNPTRARGVGVRAFALTGRGLLVGSDTDELAREYHGRIGLFPR